MRALPTRVVTGVWHAAATALDGPARRLLRFSPVAAPRSRGLASFPSALTTAATETSAQPAGGAAGQDVEGHHTPSTLQPQRQARGAAEDVLWAPITGQRLGSSGGGGGGGGGGGSASQCEASASVPSAGAPPRLSTLHRPFMGTSTRFRNPHLSANVSITRQDIQQLERERLSHSPPGRINDHLCIAMTRALRWLADRAFRERYIHRATMLVTIAPAAPAAAAVAAYVRMMVAPRSRLDMAPYVHPDAASASGGAPRGGSGVSGSAADASTPPPAWAPRKGHSSYADELRGLFSQSESHAVHYQILVSMAEILPVERALVLVLQALHFSVFLVIFLVYPRMGFRLMAYMAEESSVVWTQMVNDIDLGKIAEHRVPELALGYWGLQARFTAQEALVPAVLPRPMTMTPDLARDSADSVEEDVAATAASGSGGSRGRGGTGASGPTEEPPAQPPGPLRVARPRYSRLTTRSDDEAAALARRAALDGNRLTLRDVVLLIRSDEMVYRDLNHRTADALDKGPREPGVIASYIRNSKWQR